MRLVVSRNAGEEQLTGLLNEGYELLTQVQSDRLSRIRQNSFHPEMQAPRYKSALQAWVGRVEAQLLAIFPTPLECRQFALAKSFVNIGIDGFNRESATLLFQSFPLYLERLHEILNTGLRRYTDLPIQDRLFVEHIDSFQRVRDVNPAMVLPFLQGGRLDWAEDRVQIALEQILDVPFHRVDWAGEINDLYTANVVINGARRATGFLLKGRGTRKVEMTIADCGANGDQLVRLFCTPATLFVVQFVGPISELLIRDVHGKVAELRALNKEAHFLVMDGQDTARLLHAYGKLP